MATRSRIVFTILAFLFCLLPTVSAQDDQQVRIAFFPKTRIVERGPDGVSGFAVDVMEYIAEEMGWKLEWVQGTLPESLRWLEGGEVDLICPLGYTPERDEVMDFSEEVFLTTWGRVYMMKNSEITSLLHLEGKRIAYVKNSFFYPKLKDLLSQFDIESEFIEAPSYKLLFQKLASGEADAGVADRLEAYADLQNERISENAIVFYPFGLHMAAAENDPRGLLEAIDWGLKSLKADLDSLYYTSQKKWISQSRSSFLPEWLIWLTGILLVGGLLVVLWSFSLRRQVRVRTREIVHLQSLLSNIIDSMPSILIGVNTEGRVIQWNAAAIQRSNIPADKALGQPIEELLPDYKNELVNLKEIIRSRQASVEHRKSRKLYGKTVIEDITIYPLISNSVSGAVLRIDDVTQRVRMEEMMIQSEKMISVGGLAAGMAHEINNPLAGILQNANVIKNRLTTDLDSNRRAAARAHTDFAAIREYVRLREIDSLLEYIVDSGRRTSKIVKNMLEFARKGDLQHSSTDLAALVERTIDLASSDYNLKKKFDFGEIAFKKEFDSDLPRISCEASKIQQVILNLLANGAEAMSEKKSRLSEEAEYQPTFTIRLFANGETLQCEIEDNGTGIEENEKQHIFEPFFTSKEVGRGTGLGLSVSYFIITEEHRGSMELETQEGEGSRFIIRLPVE